MVYLSFYQKSLLKNNWLEAGSNSSSCNMIIRLEGGGFTPLTPSDRGYFYYWSETKRQTTRLRITNQLSPLPIKRAWICICVVVGSDWRFDNLRRKSKSEWLRWWLRWRLPLQDYSYPDDKNPKSTLSKCLPGEWLLDHFWINLVKREFWSSKIPLGDGGMVWVIYFKWDWIIISQNSSLWTLQSVFVTCTMLVKLKKLWTSRFFLITRPSDRVTLLFAFLISKSYHDSNFSGNCGALHDRGYKSVVISVVI